MIELLLTMQIQEEIDKQFTDFDTSYQVPSPIFLFSFLLDRPPQTDRAMHFNIHASQMASKCDNQTLRLCYTFISHPYWNHVSRDNSSF